MRRALTTWVAIGASCLALICSVHSAASQEGTQLKIGFWNIRDLSTASRNSSELDQIATVAHAIDCLAICELNDGTVLDTLKANLQTGAKIGNTPNTAERYGFLYRSDKLKVSGIPHVLPELSYLVPGEAQPRKLDREPFVCSFATLDGRFDFTMIVVHITWGAKAACRIGEIKVLINYFEQVKAESSTDNNVLLCGDFNRNVDDSASLGVLLSSIPTLTPEEKARVEIDAIVTASGWVVSDYKELNPSAVRGIDFQQVALQADNLGTDPIRPAAAKEIDL